MSVIENEEHEAMNGGELVYRAAEPASMRFSEGDGGSTLEGRMMPYDEPTEIKSSVEGHFMESFASGSLDKTMDEQSSRMRVLYDHGLDNNLGKHPIADIESLRSEADGAWYRADLLDGLPPLLLSGLRRGLYGSSIKFKPVKWDRVRFPKRSESNPDGIEERTVREASIKELSVVTFPAYSGATAAIRSLTDEIEAKRLLGDPERLLEYLRSTSPPTEPQHLEPEEPEDQAPEPSRSTQVTRDYLNPPEGDPSWRL